MGLLESISTPRDLRTLTDDQLTALASEIRDLLVGDVRAHRRPPRPQPRRRRADHGDPPGLRLARATGSSSTPATRPTSTRCSPAVPPASTGCARRAGSPATRARPESEHDIVENSHASTALSYADGLAKAYAIRGEDRHVVAVIGDGALTGGMAWEALNNIAIAQDSTAGDRRQRQRPLLHPDHRRSRHRAHRRCAPTRATSRCSTWSRSASPRSRASAPRPTTRCTR